MFWRNLIVLSLSPVLLCSCLDQRDPASGQQPVTPKFQGVVEMVDQTIGNQAGAALLAQFAPVQAKASAFFLQGKSALKIAQTNPPDTKCTFEVDPADVPPLSKTYDAGTLSYATFESDDSALIQIPYDSKNGEYFYNLRPSFGSGVYRVVASGSTDIPAFTEKLYVPEALSNVGGNGASFLGGVTVKKSVPFLLQWDQEATPHPSVDEVEFEVAISQTQIQKLTCLIHESQLETSNGTVYWSIDSSELTQLSSGLPAAITLKRELVAGSSDSAFQDVVFVGLREASPASVTVTE